MKVVIPAKAGIGQHVIPAKAGIQRLSVRNERHWVPAFAGTTNVSLRGDDERDPSRD